MPDRLWRRGALVRSRRTLKSVLLACPMLVSLMASAPQAQAASSWGAPVVSSAEADGPALTALYENSKFGAEGAIDRPPSDVLSGADQSLYQQIFDAQAQAQWETADALIARLSDRLLMGHVLYQRYMHPQWTASFAQLQSWLQAYNDLPGARNIYTLAKKRAESDQVQTLPYNTWSGALHQSAPARDATSLNGPEGRYSAQGEAEAERVWSVIRRTINNDDYATAAQMIQRAQETGILVHLDANRLKAALASALFFDGDKDGDAVRWAQQAIYEAGDQVPLALWAGALASWRQGDIPTARQWFNRLSQASGVPPWMSAGGAYWSARAALRDRRPQDASRYLTQAAEQPRTFYGLLARRALGLPSRFQWEATGLSAGETAALAQSDAGRRSLALVQVGQSQTAEQELRGFYPQADSRQRAAALRLADVGGMASLAMQLASARDSNGDSDGGAISGVIDNARYPVPSWEPKDGWRLDRALIYAFARQESAFRPQATSSAGAQGLMQVMPATAQFIQRKDRALSAMVAADRAERQAEDEMETAPLAVAGKAGVGKGAAHKTVAAKAASKVASKGAAKKGAVASAEKAKAGKGAKAVAQAVAPASASAKSTSAPHGGAAQKVAKGGARKGDSLRQMARQGRSSAVQVAAVQESRTAPRPQPTAAAFSPEISLSLGQRYLEHLLEQPEINGNLLYAAAAYNGGPGNLKKWLRRDDGAPTATSAANDPLMFVESIPLRETRLYVQRVMANMWIYQDRLGQGSPTLDHVAAGDWPRYVPVDRSSLAMVPPGGAFGRK